MSIEIVDTSLSYAHGVYDAPLIGATIGDLFDRVVAQVPNNEALVSCHQRRRYTDRQLQEEVDRFACGLLALGIQQGDRVGIWSPSHAEWIVTQLATAKLGAILVNINPAYRVTELEYALRQSGCSALVIAPPFKTSHYAALLGELCPELARATPGDLHAVRLPELRTVIAFGDQRVPGAYHWEDVVARAPSVAADELAQRQRQLGFDDPINIQYTSGTTGFPKGATLSHHGLLNNGFLTTELQRFTDQDRLCVPVPFYHCFAMVCGTLGCLTHGATVVVPAPAFDPLSTLEALAAERCTALYGVPTMFVAMLNHPEFARFDLTSLRTGCMGGSPCPIEVIKQVRERMHMTDLEIIYGMTELSPAAIQGRLDDPLEKRLTTIGRPHPHVECKIVDPVIGAVVPRGQPGELHIRGYLVMLGYWQNPEATAKAIDSARWLHSGDLATMDAEGYLNIVGRSKEMIIRGGENIYPREIEDFLYRHPKIKDVQVVGVPDEAYGEEVMAWVILKPGERADGDELRAFCQGQISHYKIPRYWSFVEAFPMTVTGKIQKFRLREMAIEELKLEKVAAIRTA
jgi:fatty-acyl-CoA synthase